MFLTILAWAIVALIVLFVLAAIIYMFWSNPEMLVYFLVCMVFLGGALWALSHLGLLQ